MSASAEPSVGCSVSKWGALHPWGALEGAAFSCRSGVGGWGAHLSDGPPLTGLAGWLPFSPPSLFVWVATPPANSQPRGVCGPRPRLRPAASAEGSTALRSPAGPGSHAASKVGAGRRSQNCPESKQLRTPSGLVRRLAATKGHCEGCPGAEGTHSVLPERDLPAN